MQGLWEVHIQPRLPHVVHEAVGNGCNEWMGRGAPIGPCRKQRDGSANLGADAGMNAAVGRQYRSDRHHTVRAEFFRSGTDGGDGHQKRAGRRGAGHQGRPKNDSLIRRTDPARSGRVKGVLGKGLGRLHDLGLTSGSPARKSGGRRPDLQDEDPPPFAKVPCQQGSRTGSPRPALLALQARATALNMPPPTSVRVPAGGVTRAGQGADLYVRETRSGSAGPIPQRHPLPRKTVRRPG